eukprot:Plantae.Rhodophyta-Purpureofilum_apyrenoidigerum.ctg10953.p1 GENE.Plantae.Rhodophyta-Purpureofilum_apyrenoidigerum.ctg10953~~Plantae.Rhodophyta-Purpureofilum_apyrenoidigerum.ctg10953.p1  ORF type:complete len:884 (+),score=149.55 Plantae.Rhodophyta-Purpureofilum_apyrenoidigerum.ctg10953:302-2953(+)
MDAPKLEDSLPCMVHLFSEANAERNKTYGNVYKDLLESTSMGNGMKYVFLINVFIGMVGMVLFVFVKMRFGALSRAEIKLLREYPSPQEREEPGRMDFVYPPPLTWTNIADYIFGENTELSDDAQTYLMFLRICVAVCFVLGFSSCTVLIPAYFFGGQQKLSLSNAQTSLFTRTTAHNIPGNSLLLYLQLPVWIFVGIGLSYLYVTIQVVAGKQRYEWQSAAIFSNRWTIFFRELPLDLNESDKFYEVLEEFYPGEVDDVELVYQGRLSGSRRQKNIERLQSRLLYFERQLQCASSEQLEVECRRHRFSFSWFTWRSVSSKVESLKEEIKKLERPDTEESKFLRCAFVSFKSERAMHRCLRDFRGRHIRRLWGIFDALFRRHDARTAKERLRYVVAELAPKPKDVIWKNVGIDWWQRALSQTTIPVLVFLLMISFTSPVAILWGVKQMIVDSQTVLDPFINGFNGHGNNTLSSPDQWWSDFGGVFSNITGNFLPDDDISFSISDILMEMMPDFVKSSTEAKKLLLSYAPTLFLTLINALVPSVLRAVSVLEKYKTRSELEVSILRKTIFYFVMNLIILPAFALNTASQLVKWIFQSLHGKRGQDLSWLRALPISERLYTGDIAFFLCNYLIQLAFTGNVQWLLMPTQMSASMWKTRVAMTNLEKAEAKCVGLFDYPRHYAYVITTMSVCFLFGAMAPLLWMFSFFFLALMYLIDRYNIRYVYSPSHTDYRLPRSGANFLLSWVALSMLIAALNYYVHELQFAAGCTLLVLGAVLLFNFWRVSQFEIWVLRGLDLERLEQDGILPLARNGVITSPSVHFDDQKEDSIEETHGTSHALPLSNEGTKLIGRRRASWYYSAAMNDVEEQDESDVINVFAENLRKTFS